MKLATVILKNLLLPQLEKDNQFELSKISESFLDSFVKALYDFEKDAKPVYALLYRLELKDTEKVISKLDAIYIAFIKEMAENYVLGHASEIHNLLLETKNITFEKEIHFFINLEKAIKKAERKNLSAALPNSYGKMTFEVKETLIANVIKKTSRDDLKKKMMNWDNELVEEKVPALNLDNNNQSKVISLYWIKYAVAACFVLGLGVWFYTNQNIGTLPDTNVVTAPDIKARENGTNVLPSIASEALAEVTSVSKNNTVLEEGMGMTANSIRIIENNQKARKESIINAIEKYQKLLEKEFTVNKVSDTPISKELNSRIDRLQNELNLLNEREQKYLFDGKVLTVYVATISKENRVLDYNDNYYLAKETVFYNLTTASKLQSYKKVTDTDLLTVLDEILN